MSIMRNLVNNQKGQGLVEALIAVAVAIIVVASLISLSVFSLRNSRQASYVAQATQIAQTQLEYMRYYRDVNTWQTVLDLANNRTCFTNEVGHINTMCRFNPPISGSSYTYTPSMGEKDNFFFYHVNIWCIENCTDSEKAVVRANVHVWWTIGGKKQDIYNTSDYTNWKGK